MKLKSNYDPKPFEMYCIFDPAIDQDKSNIEEYAKTRDTSHLQFKPGSKPTKFFVRNIPNMITTSPMFSNPNNGPLINASYFAYGVSSIEDLHDIFLTPNTDIQQDGLNIVEPTTIVQLAGGNSIKAWELSDVIEFFNKATIDEVASVVQKKTHLMKGTKLVCPVLPSSTVAIQITNG